MFLCHCEAHSNLAIRFLVGASIARPRAIRESPHIPHKKEGAPMERFWTLNRYQKAILCILVLMVLGFGVLYAVTTSRMGYPYHDTLLIPTQEGGNTVYSGEIYGMPASFTVTPDKTVTYQYGLKTYGPYTILEDATAIPKGKVGKGVEVRCGEEIIFRGSVENLNYGMWLTNEDGSSFGGNITVTSSNGIIYDENGHIIDQNEPSVGAMIQLAFGPELTHKGHWGVWFIGLALCVICAISILFADELFQWRMSYRVRDAYEFEPSDLEISSRYIVWTLDPIFALIIFILGLQ